jgi:sialic acid synthase SpsE
MADKKPFIIGETAFHHEGDPEFLIKLIDSIAETKVDAVKFHLLLDLDDYIISEHDVTEILKKWMFSTAQWDEFIDRAISNKLKVILLCNDVKSVEYAVTRTSDVFALEIHATGLNDLFLLNKTLLFKGPVILGIGGSTLDEIQFAVDFYKQNNKNDIILMYGFQSFPTNYADINFSKMVKLKNIFGLEMGYADHTDPNDKNNILISSMPISMGVTIIEKHITNRFGEKRTDFQAAVDIEKMKEIVEAIEVVYSANGNGDLSMSEPEKNYGNTGPMKKAIVAKRTIEKGEFISLDNVAYKRTNDSSYIKQNQLPLLIGLEVLNRIEKDEIIDFSKVNYIFKKSNFKEFKIK